jgi:hypothetical protein
MFKFVILRNYEHMEPQSKPSCMFGTTNAKERLDNSAWLSKLAPLQFFWARLIPLQEQ